MPKIASTLQNIPSGDSNWLRLRNVYERAARIMNGKLSFGNGTQSDNIAGTWVTIVTPATPNTDFIVTHNLGYVASGYKVMSKNAACDFYTSPTVNPSPDTELILRATVGSVTVTFFVV